MITENSISETEKEEQPQPTVPASDPRAVASDLDDIEDPYAEASRRKALASA